MEDLSQIVGFIITIIIVIASAFRKSKKRPVVKSNNYVSDSFSPAVFQEEAINEDRGISSNKNNPRISDKKDKKQTLVKNDKNTIVKNEKKKTTRRNPNNFNLRKAIIYTEILKPKEF
jgi:hypothetical protein